MAKISAFIFFILFSFWESGIYAAELKGDIKDDRAEFVFSFAKGYSAFEELEDEANKTLIFTFDTSENIVFERQNYFNLPIKSAYLSSEGYKKRFFVEFKTVPVKPIVKTDNKSISIVFPLPEIAAPADIPKNTGDTVREPAPIGAGNYAKTIFGLTVVLIIIFLLFWVIKTFFKKQIFSDIPGSGRLLGKVDLELRKSLYFYEIGDTIYIIGVTDGGMNVIDKITEEAEAAKIRSGFIKKHEFKGYMSFFKNKNTLDDEIAASGEIVKEKLKSLRKRK